MQQTKAKKKQRLLWCGRNTGEGGGGSIEQFHDIPLPSNFPHIVDVSAGHDHVLILTEEGEVYSLGTNPPVLGHPESWLYDAKTFDHPRKIEALSGVKIVQIAAGLYASTFLDEQGDTWVSSTSCRIPEKVSMLQGKTVRAIHGGLNDCIVVTDTGYSTVANKGSDSFTPFPESSNGQIILSAMGGSLLTITENGTLSSPGYYATNSVHLQERAQKIAAKGSHALVLTGFPEWSKETHRLYPSTFKEAVKTLLLMAQRDAKKEPRHPEAPFHLLPTELLFSIIQEMSSHGWGSRKVYKVEYTNLELQSITLPSIPIDVAAGWTVSYCLTEDGLYTWGAAQSFNEGGRTDLTAEPAKVQQLDGLNVTRVWAGYYYGLVMVED